MSGWFVVFAAIGYVLSLFVVASYGDRRRRRQPQRLGSPLTYALSLAIYCTSWTFFGSVGLAATAGFEFLAIYVGPILAVTVGHRLFAHIIAVSKAERVTSVADFIASRYGKSPAVGALAAGIAVLGTVPYIALQLKAVSISVDTLMATDRTLLPNLDTGLVVAVLLAFFAVLFGTRQADATEHQAGLVMAVALESVVKLAAFLLVGVFTLFVIFSGPLDLFNRASAAPSVLGPFLQWPDPARFGVLTLLSFFAFLLLPRQFHMGVVENGDARETRAARWLFPTYLVLINLFVVPVAIAGLVRFGTGVDADTYVLALPISEGATWLTALVFIGGLSAATAMVIVGSVALAIMVSNNLVLPLLLARVPRSGRDMGGLLLNIRRTTIFVILALSYLYVRLAGDSAALASIGLLSFAAIAQFAPAFFGGMVWRGGTATGATAAMAAGFAVWVYTLFLPTLLDADAGLLVQGAFGLPWLRPYGMFGLDLSPLIHGTVLSLGINAAVFVVISLLRRPRHRELVQAAAFSFTQPNLTGPASNNEPAVTRAELKATVANYLGYERTERAFAHDGTPNAGPRDLASSDDLLLAEKSLTSAIGAASARLVMSLLLRRHDDASNKTLKLLDDASRALRENRDRLHTAIDQVDQGLCVLDNRLELSNWNRRFRTLLSLPERIGQPGTPLATIADAIASNGAGLDGETIAEKMLDTGVPWNLRVNVDGGGVRIVEVLSRPLPEGGIVSSWRDITQTVEAARALREANEGLERRVEQRTAALSALNNDLAAAREAAEAADASKTRFLAAVGHDILQPLNAARLYASTLVESADGNVAELAGNVDGALESVEEILGAVLAISRLDAGAQQVNLRHVPIAPMFERLARDFSPMAAQKDLHLRFEANALSVRSDPALLRRLLQNLVSNALCYTSEGEVCLSAIREGSRVRLTVTDTGCGIGPEDKATIFKEFSRLRSGRALSPGLGLGLSIVERLSTALHHPLDVESTLGEGSTFSLTAPWVETKAPAKEKRTQPTRGIQLSGLKVLCIDNEARIRDGMAHLLTNWGCEVQTCADAASACALPRPDVVIADYHLDEELGLDAVAALRALHGAELPAILATADRSLEVAGMAEAAGVAVLNKPVKPAALRAYLTTVSRVPVEMPV